MNPFAKILQGFKLILALLISTVLLPTVCILSIPVFTVRWIVQLVAKCLRPNFDGILKPASAILAVDSLTTHPTQNETIVLRFENQVELQELRKTVLENIFFSLITKTLQDFEYERLRQSVTSYCGYFFWKKQPGFEISDYVRLYEKSIKDYGPIEHLPVRDEYGPEDLKQILSYLVTKPWRKEFSLWEIILLNNYRPSNSSGSTQSVALFHFHHTIADGYSILKFIKLVCDNEGDPLALPKQRKATTFSLIISPVLFPFKAIFDLAVHLAERQLDGNDWLSHPYNPKATTYKVTFTDPIPIDRIKNVKRKFGVSFLAVLQAVTAGALRRMMKATESNVPDKVTCYLPLPLPNHRGGLRVHMAGALSHLHVGEIDPVARLKKSTKDAHTLATSAVPLLYYYGIQFVGASPNFLNRHGYIPGLTAGVSHFPGLTSPLLLKSGTLEPNACHQAFFTVGMPHNFPGATLVTSLSHCSSVIFAVIVRDNIFQTQSQLDKFQEFIVEEIENLEMAEVTVLNIV